MSQESVALSRFGLVLDVNLFSKRTTAMQETEYPADLFTKCLHSREFVKHGAAIGFLRVDGPVQDSMSLAPVSEKGLAFVEVCCKGRFIASVRMWFGIPYAGVVKDAEPRGARRQREIGCWTHMHISTPCSSGPPFKNFSSSETKADCE